MKRKIISFAKVITIIIAHFIVFIGAIFITMTFLIKGEEIKTPDFIGKNLREAYEIASKTGIYLKKSVGFYNKNYQPLTVFNQSPAANERIKENSVVVIYVTPELMEVKVPELAGFTLKECEAILKRETLSRRNISYMNAEDIPYDSVIGQSIPAGESVVSGSEVDVLVSSGKREKSYIMPNLIGKEAQQVIALFAQYNLPIVAIKEVAYNYVNPGTIIKQHPASGFRINEKTRISLEVSQ
jgi:serine/threonine-protein kinase